MIAYGVFSDDPTASAKIKEFFEQFQQLPSWFTNLWILVVASIEQLYFDENLVSETGFLRLDKANVVTINGCDGYALPTLLNRFDYQRPKK